MESAIGMIKQSLTRDLMRVQAAFKKPMVQFYAVSDDDHPVKTVAFDGTLKQFHTMLREELLALKEKHGECFGKWGNISMTIGEDGRLKRLSK